MREIEFLDPYPSFERTPGNAPVRFRDHHDAEAFLRGIASEPASMPGLRDLLGDGADSSPGSLMTDGEVMAQLATRLWSGALKVIVRNRPWVEPPQIGGEDEPEKHEAAPVKEDQDVEFEITDHFDDPFTGLEWVLLYPDGKTKKTGKLGDDGKVSEKSVPPGNYQLSFKIVSAARWGDQQVEIDKEVKLQATAAGFDPGESGKFEIFDDRAMDQKPLAKVDGKVSAARVLEASWTPSKDALKDVTSGSLVLRAKIGASAALSSPVPVVVKHSFELEDDDGKPLADTTVVAHFSDGHQSTGEAKGGKLDLLVPLGQKLVWVDLPDHPGAHLTLEEEGDDPREYLLWESSDEAPVADDAEGDDDGGEDEDSDEDDSDDGDSDDESDEDEDEDEDSDGDGADAGV